MSSGPPSARPEFFLDRGIGKRTAQLLSDEGWLIHPVAEHYPNDAQNVGDEEWIAEGCSRGWTLLCKDRRIRYRAWEIAELNATHKFCLSRGTLTTGQMVERLLAAETRILRAIDEPGPGFWHVYEDGGIKRMWPA